jgi:hypothetical protein
MGRGQTAEPVLAGFRQPRWYCRGAGLRISGDCGGGGATEASPKRLRLPATSPLEVPEALCCLAFSLFLSVRSAAGLSGRPAMSRLGTA